jgi:hypothetical protein
VIDHAEAVLSLLRQVPDLVVFPEENGTGDGKLVPDGTEPPYVAVHFHREYGEAEDATGATTRIVLRPICHCVGETQMAAQAVSTLVAGALLDVTPSIPDRECFPIRHEGSVPARDDESTGRRVVDLTETYRLETVPA